MEEQGSILSNHRFDGPTEFAASVRLMLAHAAAQNWQEIILCDPDFAGWPLAEREVFASLQDWSKSGRSMVILAEHYRYVEAHHARFVQWRQQWAHIVQAYALAPEHRAISAIVTPGFCLQRLDLERSRGIVSNEASVRLGMREVLNELRHKASRAFAATKLGL